MPLRYDWLRLSRSSGGCAGSRVSTLSEGTTLKRLAYLWTTPESERWPDADWPDKKAFEDAWQFTKQLPENLKELPHISLAYDGEVKFAWSGGAIHVDLGFYGAGTFSYYGRDSDGREVFGDDIPVTSSFPKDLAALLSA